VIEARHHGSASDELEWSKEQRRRSNSLHDLSADLAAAVGVVGAEFPRAQPVPSAMIDRAELPVHRNSTLKARSAMATRYAQITIVPSHDLRGYASILEWSRSTTR
jgi:hypothetical protein